MHWTRQTSEYLLEAYCRNVLSQLADSGPRWSLTLQQFSWMGRQVTSHRHLVVECVSDSWHYYGPAPSHSLCLALSDAPEHPAKGYVATILQLHPKGGIEMGPTGGDSACAACDLLVVPKMSQGHAF
jgi:hypothetical protein